MGKSMKLIMALMIVLAITPCYAAAPSDLTLYDNFTGTFIHPTLWFGQEYESNTSNRVLRESVRQIEKGQLHLKASVWGCTQCGSTNTQYGQNRLNATGLANATVLQASVLVKSVAVTGTDNPNPANAKARLLGYFFNNGGSTGSSDFSGDVYAYIAVERSSDSPDPPKVLEVHGRVWVCTNASCTNSTQLGETDQLGTLTVGKKATLYMQWDKATNQVLFKVTVGKISHSQAVEYGTPLAINAPVYNNKRLEVYCLAADSTTSQGLVLMDAYFDDLYYK